MSKKAPATHFYIDDCAADIARVIAEIARQHPIAEQALQTYYYIILKWMMRHLEDFITPLVSEEAQRKADKMGLGDLRRYRWRHQPRRMRDPKREIFHWEHATQTSDMAKAVIRLTPPSPDNIAAVLRTITVVWITKRENKKLPPGERPDWRSAYEQAGIKLLPYPLERGESIGRT